MPVLVLVPSICGVVMTIAVYLFFVFRARFIQENSGTFCGVVMFLMVLNFLFFL